MSHHDAEMGLISGPDGASRCWWAGDDPLYVAYHDEEWGFPMLDDRRLFEKLCLEGFQAGLAWVTVLRKREAFRRAFARFDIETVARFGDTDIERLVADTSIIRHRGKIVSAVNNARRVLDVQAELGSFAALLWRYEVPGPPPTRATMPAKTPESTALTRELKRRGFSFVGPTTIYAYMQSIGLVNDHLAGCATRARVTAARRVAQLPG